MVDVYCHWPEKTAPRPEAYVGEEINRMVQKTLLNTNPSKSYNPSKGYSSTEEMNQWLSNLMEVPTTRTVDTLGIPHSLKQKALDNPGSVSLDEWISAMRPGQITIETTTVRPLHHL